MDLYILEKIEREMHYFTYSKVTYIDSALLKK